MINGPGGIQYTVAQKQTQQGGDWFFWVAGLSVVNAVLLPAHAPFGFFFSLGAAGFAARAGGGLPTYLAVVVVASAVIGLCGLFARRGARWAFLVGMGLYALDALVCLSMGKYLENRRARLRPVPHLPGISGRRPPMTSGPRRPAFKGV